MYSFLSWLWLVFLRFFFRSLCSGSFIWPVQSTVLPKKAKKTGQDRTIKHYIYAIQVLSWSLKMDDNNSLTLQKVFFYLFYDYRKDSPFEIIQYHAKDLLRCVSVAEHQQTVELTMWRYVTLQMLQHYAQRDLCYRLLQTNCKYNDKEKYK